MTKITVITVCFNAAETIADTIRSVASQTYHDLEYIVIDGGSNDDTVSILKRFSAQISYWTSEPDNGLYDAMNKGLSAATGDYVGFLNSDDFFFSSSVLQDVAAAIQQVGADATYGDCLIVDAEDPSVIRRYYSSRYFKTWHLRFGNIPPHASIYIRRTLLIAEGGFKTHFKIAADFDLLLRIFLKRKAKLNYVPNIITRNRGGGISNNGLQSTLSINKEIRQSLLENGFWSPRIFLWSRYLFKIRQFFFRPKQELLGPSSWFK